MSRAIIRHCWSGRGTNCDCTSLCYHVTLIEMVKKILIALAIIFADYVFFGFLGLLMMQYEDFYHEGLGEWYSLESMKPWQRVAWFAYLGWLVLNAAAIIYIIYRVAVALKARNV